MRWCNAPRVRNLADLPDRPAPGPPDEDREAEDRRRESHGTAGFRARRRGSDVPRAQSNPSAAFVAFDGNRLAGSDSAHYLWWGPIGQDTGTRSPRVRSSRLWRARTRCASPSWTSTSAASGFEL